MSATMPRELKWGILATGAISLTFARDILMDPKIRGVNDIKHTVVAAASSSGESRAAKFLAEAGAPKDAKPYGSYEELVKDTNIDIIYVATPHSHHYQNVRLCLEAGHNVLCEKAFTVNANQARVLVDLAREKNLFLMEAFWTRYFPLTDYVREVINSGRIGRVMRVTTNAGAATNPEETWADGQDRIVNMALAGGACLDMGVYALTWPFLALYEGKTPKVTATGTRMKHTGADDQTAMQLTFPREGGDAIASAFASLRIGRLPGDKTPAVWIQGTQGSIEINNMCQMPEHSRLILKDGTIEEKHWPRPGPGKGSGWYNGWGKFMNEEGVGQGMFWEADEAARALFEGRKEGKHMGLDESIAVMEVLDEARRQCGLRYPENLETTDYPVKF